MYPITMKNAAEHAITLEIGYDPDSPFYKMINFKEFWERPPEEKVLVMGFLPEAIVDHITELYQANEL